MHAGDPVVVHQFGELLEERFLGLLVGDLGEDDLGAAVLGFLDLIFGAEDHAAPTRPVCVAEAEAIADGAAGREIGTGDDLGQSVGVDVAVVDIGDDGVADLSQVVGRDRGCHADGDPARAVDEQVRELGGKDAGFLVLLVVVRLKVDGVELDILKHLARDWAELCLGVPHRRRREPVDRAEVSWPVINRWRMFHHCAESRARVG